VKFPPLHVFFSPSKNMAELRAFLGEAGTFFSQSCLLEEFEVQKIQVHALYITTFEP
jgi:hypothetical protein